jgi:hypothetical protein
VPIPSIDRPSEIADAMMSETNVAISATPPRAVDCRFRN